MNIKLLAATVAVLLPLAGYTDEGNKTPDPGMHSSRSASFDSLDANKDGRISMPEASADPKLLESFSTADKNGDGYLDRSEYANAVSDPPAQ